LSYSPENWQTISKLLDQALDLPREARESWLETLPEPDSAFREQLREMLAHQAAAETADFLETLPKLTAVGLAIIIALFRRKQTLLLSEINLLKW